MRSVKNKREVIEQDYAKNQILKTEKHALDIVYDKSERKARKARKPRKSRGILRKLWGFTYRMAIIFIVIGLFIMYGPSTKFRDWYITTAMTTMNHQYLATWFYSTETIQDVMDRNKMIEVDSVTDPSLIEFEIEEIDDTEYENEYEEAVLKRDKSHPEYKIIRIKESSFAGYLAVIYDPSSIQALVTSKLDEEGQYLMDMAEEAGATIAINGGVFTGLSTSTEDLKSQEIAYGGNGGKPQGITIRNGEVITNTRYDGAGGLIGFTNDNKLVLGKMNLDKAQSLGVRDAVTCGPFLIINGESSSTAGNGGWGTAPRTAIGQRQDGIVLMLSVDGRRATMPGATMPDLIKIMQNYGAYNASALDGGTSTAMVENGKLLNDPIDSTGAHATRPIATGFGAVFNKQKE